MCARRFCSLICILLFIKTTKNIFSHGVFQYVKNPSYSMSFSFFEIQWRFTVKTYRIKFESQLFEELKTEPKKKRVNKAWQTENMERMYQDGFP